MTLYQQAQAVYESEPCARTFEQDLQLHLDGGYVVSTPTLFAMFRPVNSNQDHEAIVNPAWGCEFADCWHLYLVAGDFRELFELPFPALPFVSFERKNVLRFYDFEKIRNRAMNTETWT